MMHLLERYQRKSVDSLNVCLQAFHRFMFFTSRGIYEHDVHRVSVRRVPDVSLDLCCFCRCSVVSVCVSSYMAACVMHVVKKTDILDESGGIFLATSENEPAKFVNQIWI